jgi:hypothetical protein
MAVDRVALLNTLMDASVAALASGDYSTAVNKALAAQGILATLPQVSRSAGTGGGSQAAQWDGQAIDSYVKRLRQQQGASLGIQSVPIQFVEPVALDDGSQFANANMGAVQ